VSGGIPEFEDVYRAEFPHAFRTAYLITGNRQDALELAQEALARAFERWHAVRRMDRPGAWIQRVVANLSLTATRRRRSRPSFPARDAVPEPEPSDPALFDALASLTVAQRTVLVMRYFLDLSVREVAADLGKRPGTVTALTSQGLAALRKRLDVEVTREARG
jgi:RNA polymerase sigma-70 factor (sigma-E family)